MSGWLRDALQTALRLLPWPTEPGLRRIGTPGRGSPVLLTSNYDLTVRRLLRALAGVDAWLLVAPAGGINVWCAAAGGHLTTHQVVSVLKTSGIGDLVDHRDLIVPQLAATGVDGLDVFRRAHWRVRFGPVRASDVPAYLTAGCEKDDAMRRVDFPLRDRLEMAVAWAAPTSLAIVVGCLALRPGWTLPLLALCWGLAGAVFLAFDRLPAPRAVLLAAAWALSLGLVAGAGGGAGAYATAALAPPLLVTLLTFDYSGSTPLVGSAQLEGHDWRITLDAERCAAVYRCFEVCPEACFEKPAGGGVVVLAHDERCVHCGACVVQCPKDALAFEDGAGQRVEPDTIRRFKLNLLGRRAVRVTPREPTS